jgi:hypothetical protein
MRDGESVKAASEPREDEDEISAHSGQREDHRLSIHELENGNGNSGDMGLHTGYAPPVIEESQDANMEDIEVDIDENALTKLEANNPLNSEGAIEEAIVSTTRDMPGIDTIVPPSNSLTSLKDEMKEESISNTIPNNPMQEDNDEKMTTSILILPPDSLQKATMTEESKVENPLIATSDDNEKENQLADTEHLNDAASTTTKIKGMTLISDIPRKVEDAVEEMVEEAEEENVDQASQSPDATSDEKVSTS